MSKNAIKGTLRSYLRWPIILAVLLIVMNIQIYTIDLLAGLVMSGYVTIYLLIAILLYCFKRKALLQDLVNYAMEFHHRTKVVAKNMELPMAILDVNGTCVWQNDKFLDTFAPELPKRFPITNAIGALTEQYLPDSVDRDCELHFNRDDIFYRATIQRIEFQQEDTLQKADVLGLGDSLYLLFVHDETEIVHYIRENYDQRLDIGLLYIDNYEESLATIEEVRRALLSALIDRKINKYMLKYDAITRKLEKDKYIILFQHKYLSDMQADKFSLLKEVKNINIAEEKSVTISMGIGIQADTFRKRQEYARSAIDLALARGGDQVVVKDGEDIAYFGGKAKQVERNTRVKARVKAHALHEIIESRENVIIMGHSLTDVDSLGAGIGIFCAAKVLGKKAQIVINDPTSSIRPLMECFSVDKGYPEDMFITSEIALEMVSRNTLVMVVDTNRPSYTECPELLKKTDTIVVFDHHRQNSEVIENPVLSYIEPYASSACEMVAEVLQYFQDGFKLSAAEADCIYAGILIDTNNFMTKTGVRTFEAAAYLKRSGAEVTRVRKMLRNDMACYKARAEAVRHAEVYRGAFAISVCPSENVESPTIVGAQAANELLNIIGIKASFVLTEYNGKIYIRSRSIDEINVQLIMERLGGGGHLNVAGAQLKDCTIVQAKHAIMDTLDEMLKEGDIQE